MLVRIHPGHARAGEGARNKKSSPPTDHEWTAEKAFEIKEPTSKCLLEAGQALIAQA
jgi:hypothetical protein